MLGSPCYMIIGHLWNVPVIGISTTALYPWLHQFIGQPESLPYVPNNLMNFVGEMNFWERTYNLLSTLFYKWTFSSTSNEQDNIIKKYFGPDLPSVRELERQVAMILINTHISLNGIKPTTPALVEVGGLHIYDEASTLPPVIPHHTYVLWKTFSFLFFYFYFFSFCFLFPSRRRLR